MILGEGKTECAQTKKKEREREGKKQDLENISP